MKNNWYVLNYHNISWENPPMMKDYELTIPPDLFYEQISGLKNKGFEFISFKDGLSKFESGNLNRPYFSITFDDGYVGVRKYAQPILTDLGISASVSACKSFLTKFDMFWRFELSVAISTLGNAAVKREFQLKYGRINESLYNYCLDNFSVDIRNDIRNLYIKGTTEYFRNDLFRVFDSINGLKFLEDLGWEIFNHSNNHYPIGEDTALDYFQTEFESCQEFLKLNFKENPILVLPFDRKVARSKKLIDHFTKSFPNKYLVLCGNEYNEYSNISQKIISRITIPAFKKNDLYKFLNKI